MGEWIRGLNLGFTNPMGTVRVCDVWQMELRLCY